MKCEFTTLNEEFEPVGGCSEEAVCQIEIWDREALQQNDPDPAYTLSLCGPHSNVVVTEVNETPTLYANPVVFACIACGQHGSVKFPPGHVIGEYGPAGDVCGECYETPPVDWWHDAWMMLPDDHPEFDPLYDPEKFEDRVAAREAGF